MTSEYLLDAIGLIDDDLIAEADEPLSSQALPRRRFQRWGPAIAACLIIALGVHSFISIYRGDSAYSGGGNAGMGASSASAGSGDAFSDSGKTATGGSGTAESPAPASSAGGSTTAPIDPTVTLPEAPVGGSKSGSSNDASNPQSSAPETAETPHVSSGASTSDGSNASAPPEDGSELIHSQGRTWQILQTTDALPEDAVPAGELSTDPDALWQTGRDEWAGLPLWSSGNDLYLELPDGSYLQAILLPDN